ncbi:MAG: hypothetical protein KAY78_06295 [Pseudomonadales bacterium]|jgi:chromosome segregation ATPase|nr:hypothetical protein [Pseudomonadales bacterium]
MPRRDDDLFDTQSIVPDTDDRAGHIVTPRSAPSPRSSNKPAGEPSFLKQVVVTAMLLALTAACGLFHYRNTQQQDVNAKLQMRLEALESQLGVTASTATHTSETLGEKVKSLEGRLTTTNSEISKLWGVTNDKTRKTLEEHEKSLTALQLNIADIKKSAAQIEKSASDASRTATDSKLSADNAARGISEINGSVAALQQKIAQGDPAAREAVQQATMAQEQTEQLQVKLDALNKKVSDHDESIRSIDSFRRSVNNDLGKLKQELIGPSSAPMVQ